MKIKNIILVGLTLIFVALVSFGVYSYFLVEDKDSTLTMAEKQWIEDNKNNVIDLGIVNDIPIFNYNGEGIFFDFIESIESKTGLEFNKISYNFKTTLPSAYAFEIKDELGENDLLISKDNYAILSDKEEKYNNLEEIPNLIIGVLQDDLEEVSYYLQKNLNITFKTYENINDLVEIINQKDNKTVDAIILPKTIYLSEIFTNDLNINYNINEMTKNIVLTLGDNNKLNTIIKKYYEKWNKTDLVVSYNKHFTNYYLDFNKIGDDEKVKFKSKQYKYGYINNAPYDSTIENKLVGINSEVLSSFANMAGIEIKYQPEYKSANELTKAFNENKIDFYFDKYDIQKFDIDNYNTVSTFDENIVVLAKTNTSFIVNSISSLKNYDIITIKNSKIAQELKKNEIESKQYDNIGSLLNHLNDNQLIVIDQLTYNAYKNDELKDYLELYRYTLDDNYTYNVRDIKDNKVFIKLLNFYLSFINEKQFNNKIDYSLFHTKEPNYYIYGVILLVGIIILVTIILLNKKKTKSKTISIGKDSKLKYIDILTSLKNRNYLNDQIEKWDESEIYPQTIIIVDLNNVAYINDNYGHTEGDNVIKEAANILFKNQIENSEIMRTNGNEFLIYLVQYDEKQIISYIRKLNKELKDLSHGFGAAIGYSMITDGLKTVDDAINEATLDMRSNKEEANN